MRTKQLLSVLFVGLALSQMVPVAKGGFWEDVGEMCHEIGKSTEWGCDDPLLRMVWRYIKSFECGKYLLTCEDFCKCKGENWGTCKYYGGSAYTDKSAWCYDSHGARWKCYCDTILEGGDPGPLIQSHSFA